MHLWQDFAIKIDTEGIILRLRSVDVRPRNSGKKNTHSLSL